MWPQKCEGNKMNDVCRSYCFVSRVFALAIRVLLCPARPRSEGRFWMPQGGRFGSGLPRMRSTAW